MKIYGHKSSYDYYTVIHSISRELNEEFNPDNLCSYIGDTLVSALGLRDLYIFSLLPGGYYGEVYRNSQAIMKEGPKKEGAPDFQFKTLKTLDENSEVIMFLNVFREVFIKGKYKAVSESHNKINCLLESVHCEVLVPVHVYDKLTLVMILGGKKSGERFHSEDISLLNIVANQTALAIKHARLYQKNIISEKLASIGMMSATFAHEVRNPLTSLKTCAQLMPERYDDAEFRDTFSKIVRDDVRKIEGLIRGLLDFSNKEDMFSGTDNFDLIAVIDETIDNVKYKNTLKNKNIRIEKRYGEDTIKMTGGVHMLTQAISNIIHNGCQATESGGIITVEINPCGQNVNISVQDTGIGMSNEEIARIFEPFYTTKPLGVGLGLAISKMVIEGHGGTIKVESSLSHGTNFTISLPLSKTKRFSEEGSLVL